MIQFVQKILEPVLKPEYTRQYSRILKSFQRSQGTWSLLFLCSEVLAFTQPAKNFQIVIDPGHGGTDLGGVFDNGVIRVEEKQIALKLGILAARELRAKGYQVTLTRSADFDISLGQRTQLANQMRADVFLSIHLNSTLTPMVSTAEGAQGVETYLLNAATDASSRRIAELENRGETFGIRGVENKEVALILKDLTLSANQAESKRLACQLQKELSQNGRSGSKGNRGVKQALFFVLLGAEMPSVLLEAGFITHPQDRREFLSLKGRKKIAHRIASAIERFILQKGTPAARRMLTSCKVI